MDLCSAFQKAAAEGRMINSRMTRISLPRSADRDFDSYVDCSTTITTAVHLRGYVYTHPSNRCALNFSHPDRHFPEHQHSGRQHHLELQRHNSREFGTFRS